ncbi:hypothetical protein [Actinospica durhamensis]|uniref:hypothetical protein n=1 Tax=Actinospica durhamensis TaxID=1508375 RepID=UPI001FE3C98A|nr:hypothetical protein [Actinospica durhamensis]
MATVLETRQGQIVQPQPALRSPRGKLLRGLARQYLGISVEPVAAEQKQEGSFFKIGHVEPQHSALPVSSQPPREPHARPHLGAATRLRGVSAFRSSGST